MTLTQAWISKEHRSPTLSNPGRNDYRRSKAQGEKAQEMSDRDLGRQDGKEWQRFLVYSEEPDKGRNTAPGLE